MQTPTQNDLEQQTGGGSGAAPLFAAVEARDKFFDLRYERADYSGLRPRRMVWRCRCCAPEIYQCEAATAEEAIAAALAKASELEANAPVSAAVSETKPETQNP